MTEDITEGKKQKREGGTNKGTGGGTKGVRK